MDYECTSERCKRDLGGFSGSAHLNFREFYSKEPALAARRLFDAIMRSMYMPYLSFGKYIIMMKRMRDDEVIGMELAAMSHFSDYCLDENRADTKALRADVDNLCKGLSVLANKEPLPPHLKRCVFGFIEQMGGVVQKETPEDIIAKIPFEAVIG